MAYGKFETVNSASLASPSKSALFTIMAAPFLATPVHIIIGIFQPEMYVQDVNIYKSDFRGWQIKTSCNTSIQVTFLHVVKRLARHTVIWLSRQNPGCRSTAFAIDNKKSSEVG